MLFLVKYSLAYTDVYDEKFSIKELDEQHKVDITDSGWMEYITKELGMNDTDNVLWDLA